MEPEKPEPSDCCGNGCSPCVFDIYEQRLKSWKEVPDPIGDEICYRRDLLSETRFKPFQLTHREQLINNVYLFRFQPEIGSNVKSGFLPYTIGQYLILKCNLNFENKESNNAVQPTKSETKDSIGTENQQTVTRAYTPITLSKREKNCSFSIFAKIYINGIGSEYLRSLQVGDSTLWRGPYGGFNYKPNSFKYILMLCVGSGLAPMIPVAENILSNESDETVLHLIYGVKNIGHVILRDILRNMTQFWNFTLEYSFSEYKIANDSLKFGESFKNKRIDQCSVSEFVEGKDPKQLLVLVCGTDSFTSFIINVAYNLGINPKNVFVF